ncbi:MAG TPA: NADPH-dependent FMN reductase [Streptosporangiaceae bacterium]|nr:NADPH-dependent FMN reductase [Streptosporangiaceae bacterium]
MTVPDRKRILLISGSTRDGSTNTAALRAVAETAPDWVTAELYGGLSALPAFNPDHDGADLPPAAAGLRQEIAAADAVLFCTPEYAGTLPGSFKNLLDWTVGGGELDGKSVAWLNVANQGRGGGAQATLETVLGYVGARVVGQACRRLPVGRDWVGVGGVITDPGFRAEVADAVAALASDRPQERAGSGLPAKS